LEQEIFSSKTSFVTDKTMKINKRKIQETVFGLSFWRFTEFQRCYEGTCLWKIAKLYFLKNMKNLKTSEMPQTTIADVFCKQPLKHKSPFAQFSLYSLSKAFCRKPKNNIWLNYNVF
jgi:hypothetical protein